MPIEPIIISTEEEARRVLYEHPRHFPGTRPHRIPYGQVYGAAPMLDRVPLIPREMWPDLISQKDKDGSWLDDKLAADVPPSDQDSLPFCHGFSGGLELIHFRR